MSVPEYYGKPERIIRFERGNFHGSQKPLPIGYEPSSYRMGMAVHMGNRFDAEYIRNTDAMHFIIPFMYPDRCDNQAFFTFKIDLTNLNEYLKKKCENDPEYKYNLFQVMVTAMLKTITLRPKMNRFIANKSIYQRNEVSAAFTVKKIFSDNGGERI